MKIVRIYNNNVIEAEDHGEEVILLGRGLAFGCKAGDEVSEEKVERKFTRSNEFGDHSLQYIRSLAEDIPEEYWAFTTKVMTLIDSSLKMTLRSGLYIALLDHIFVAVDRVKNNIRIPNLFGALKDYYPQEYKIAEKIVRLTEDEFNIEFDESEVLNITFHLIDAQMSDATDAVNEMTNILDGIVSIVNRRFKRLNKTSQMYERFIIHLRYFVQRAFNKTAFNSEGISSMYQTFKNNYSEENACVAEIRVYMKKVLDYDIDDEEAFYLLLHIIRVVNQ